MSSVLKEAGLNAGDAGYLCSFSRRARILWATPRGCHGRLDGGVVQSTTRVDQSLGTDLSRLVDVQSDMLIITP